MIYFLILLLGTLVGSFLNVVASRWNSGVGIKGRSFCDSCRQQLRWWELVPILSFLVLNGRCKRCRTRLSWQYPAVEAMTGIVFVTLFFAISPSGLLTTAHYVLLVVIFSIFIVITLYDLKHKIIPNALVYASISLSLLIPLLITEYTLIDWLAGPIIFAFFALIWIVTKGRALGFGDAKLGLAIGLAFGAGIGFSAIVLAFWIGTGVVLIYMLFGQKRLTMKSEVPFAPFMIVGSWLSFIYELDLLHVTLL